MWWGAEFCSQEAVGGESCKAKDAPTIVSALLKGEALRQQGKGEKKIKEKEKRQF